MPNWTSNVLDVTGKGAYAFKRLVYSARKIKGTINTEFRLEKTIPMPKELEGTSSPTDKPNKRLLKKYGSDNWYDWQLENWGCKWGACHTQDAQKIAGGYRFLFDTPWAPPVTWMIATARKFPDLTLKDTWQGDGGDGQAIITIPVAFNHLSIRGNTLATATMKIFFIIVACIVAFFAVLYACDKDLQRHGVKNYVIFKSCVAIHATSNAINEVWNGKHYDN